MSVSGISFLRKLVRPVVVRAIGDRGVEPVGLVVGAHQMIRGGLARRVGRIRRVRARLMEWRIVGLERAVHLVGRHMMKAMAAHGLAVQPQALRRLEQRMRADDIGADEIIGPEDRAIDMRFGREVHQRIDLMSLEQRAHRGLVADVAAHEHVARIATRGPRDSRGSRHRSRHRAPPPAPRARALEPMAHEIRADEAGAPGDAQVMRFEAHPASSSSCGANATAGAATRARVADGIEHAECRPTRTRRIFGARDRHDGRGARQQAARERLLLNGHGKVVPARHPEIGPVVDARQRLRPSSSPRWPGRGPPAQVGAPI